MNISVGQEVPVFELPDQNGKLVSSKSLLGHKYILFFYPHDDTISCTKEACSIRDHYRPITKLGYQIYGISPDNEKKHQKFINKYEFQYDLLADTELTMTNSFGLYGPKLFMGKEIVGVYRTTVIVNELGVITHILDKIKTAQHGQQILEALA